MWSIGEGNGKPLKYSCLECEVSLHDCSIKAQPLLLTLDKGYLLTDAAPDLERRIAPLGPPVPAQPLLLGCVVSPPGHCPRPLTWGSSFWPFLHRRSLAHLAAAPDLGQGITPLGRGLSGMGFFQLLPLTSDVG